MSGKYNNDKPEYRGLCRYCINSPECKFPRHPDRPVFYCEEYTDNDNKGTNKTNTGNFSSFRMKNSVNSNPGVPERIPGLCGICELRSTCTYPKPEGGVWHCEEYL